MLFLLFFFPILLAPSCLADPFPSDLTIYEFGSREHAYGGLRWDNTLNHPKPYAEPVKDTMASLFQYLTPETMPSDPFPMNQYTLCWNINVRVFGWHQTIIMRLFHNENEWSSAEGNHNGEYWVELNFAPNRGTLIMNANMVSDKSKSNIWSGGMGNYTTVDNPLMRWSSLCIANDFQKCWTIYYIGLGVLSFKIKKTKIVKYISDGRMVSDMYISAFEQWCNDRKPEKITRIWFAENLTGYLTNVQLYSRLLTNDEMRDITT